MLLNTLIDREGFRTKAKFTFYPQLEGTDCGPASLRMIAAYHGKLYSLRELRDACGINKTGATLRDLVWGSQRLGFQVIPVRATVEVLAREAVPPCLLLWNGNHYVVLKQVSENKGQLVFEIADPAFGLVRLTEAEFRKSWAYDGGVGTALLIEPGPDWEDRQPAQLPENFGLRRSLGFVSHHARTHRAGLIKVAFTLLVTAGISWVLPILMQRLIDEGVLLSNTNLVYLILMAQVGLVAGQTLIQFVRGKILVDLSMGISVNIIVDFLRKLIRLPLSYFDTRIHTDLLQRIDDQTNIESFISFQLIQVIFSVITLLVMSSILFFYEPLIFVIFWVLTLISVAYISIFLERRRQLDYHRFSIQSANSNALYEIITGMPEIKINSAEEGKLNSWKLIQQKVHDLKVKSLHLNHYQVVGTGAITQLKNIAITVICALWVISGDMSLGIMVSITYIIGTLTAPLTDIVNFARTAQDAKLSFERLDEVQKRPNENRSDAHPPTNEVQSLVIDQLSFQYGKNDETPVLNEVNVTIPKGKVTAIVGSSGSGKTTLMKLLLRFYLPTSGSIRHGEHDLGQLDADAWRARCGVVMQDGYIYSETIAGNVAMAISEQVDEERLDFALRMARLDEFVATLPQKELTPIGNAGVDLSGGQKQRILIARAIYRNPDYLFFDEATSLLDTVNERAIMENLERFFEGKTVIVIAHRLSTVQHADQLIVMDKGRIVETGSHAELVARRSHYYELVRNQLELVA